MGLFSPEEIERLRGHQAPPGLTEHGMAAFGFLTSPTMAAATVADQAHRGDATQEIRLAVMAEWPEIDRASRAVQHIDRELRRCARAWDQAYENSSAEEDASVFNSPSWFVSELEAFPTPVPVAHGRLTLTAADAAPTLAVLLRPEDSVFAVLAQWPRSSVAYALSIFGTRGEMSVHHGCEVEPTGSEAATLAALIAASHDSWGHGRPGTSDFLELRDYRHYQRRAIAESPDQVHHRNSSGVRLVLHRVLADGTQHLIRAYVA